MRNNSLYISLDPGVLCYYTPRINGVTGVLEFREYPYSTPIIVRELSSMQRHQPDIKQGDVIYTYSVFRKLFEHFGVNDKSLKLAIAIAEHRVITLIESYENK